MTKPDEPLTASPVAYPATPKTAMGMMATRGSHRTALIETEPRTNSGTHDDAATHPEQAFARKLPITPAAMIFPWSGSPATAIRELMSEVPRTRHHLIVIAGHRWFVIEDGLATPGTGGRYRNRTRDLFRVKEAR